MSKKTHLKNLARAKSNRDAKNPINDKVKKAEVRIMLVDENHEDFGNFFTETALMVGSIAGEGDEAFGKPCVIADKTISSKVIPSYNWTKPVTIFNPHSGWNKKVSGELATLVVAIYCVELMVDGNWNFENTWLVDALDSIKDRIVQLDGDVYQNMIS